MRRVWVVGAGGLLGRALSHGLKTIGGHVFTPEAPLTWRNGEYLLTQLNKAVSDFARNITPEDTWEIYWAAGVGTFASLASDLTLETVALQYFLDALEQQELLSHAHGMIAFASSAGAIYAGSSEEIINEKTPVAPTTPYAHAKLEQEALIRAFTERQRNVTSLVARISTLYGIGQATGKKQGLLTHIARSIVRNQPIQIYVPFDTIRDYIMASDVAARMISAVNGNQVKARHRIQLFASENPITIAEIIGTFKRVSRRTPRIVTSVTRDTALYTRRVQFRSVEAASTVQHPTTSLIVGVGQILQAERFYFAQASAR